MNPRIYTILRMSLVFAVLLSILVSFIFPRSSSVADYIIQGVLVISTITFPFLRIRLGSAFGVPFFLGIIWGFWRMAYFDSLIKNDIPGIGYIVVAIEFGIIGMIIYGIRIFVLKLFEKSHHKKAEQGAAANP